MALDVLVAEYTSVSESCSVPAVRVTGPILTTALDKTPAAALFTVTVK